MFTIKSAFTLNFFRSSNWSARRDCSEAVIRIMMSKIFTALLHVANTACGNIQR